MKRNYVFLAEGFEEIEAVTPVDVLRRAGMDVKTVSISGTKSVTGAHGVTYIADLLYEDADFSDVNWLILPGGLPGAENLFKFEPLNELLRIQTKNKGNIAAICASPGVVLGQLGLLEGKEATCYPGFEKFFGNGVYKKTTVVSGDNLITANGPASALKFSLAIVAAEFGMDTAENISSQMMNK